MHTTRVLRDCPSNQAAAILGAFICTLWGKKKIPSGIVYSLHPLLGIQLLPYQLTTLHMV